MLKTLTVESNNTGPVVELFWHPIGLTALMTLKEALKAERYEECGDAISIAREFGVASWEIAQILDHYILGYYDGAI